MFSATYKQGRPRDYDEHRRDKELREKNRQATTIQRARQICQRNVESDREDDDVSAIL